MFWYLCLPRISNSLIHLFNWRWQTSLWKWRRPRTPKTGGLCRKKNHRNRPDVLEIAVTFLYVQRSRHFLVSLVCHVSGWRATRVSHFKVYKPFIWRWLFLPSFSKRRRKERCTNLMLHSHGLPKWWACGFLHHFSRAWSSVGRHTPPPNRQFDK
jgi:hypothetical protein